MSKTFKQLAQIVFLALCVGACAQYYDNLFVQVWPREYCAQLSSKRNSASAPNSASAHCTIEPWRNFTVHGVWPEYKNGSWPSWCARDFRVEEIEGIMAQLFGVWPSFSGDTIEFWQHEWNKHGSCANMSELEYFGSALLWHKYFDLSAIAKPNTSIPYAQLNAQVTRIVGAKPYFICNGRFLAEVYVCMRDENPIDCDMTQRDACDPRKDVRIR